MDVFAHGAGAAAMPARFVLDGPGSSSQRHRWRTPAVRCGAPRRWRVACGRSRVRGPAVSVTVRATTPPAPERRPRYGNGGGAVMNATRMVRRQRIERVPAFSAVLYLAMVQANSNRWRLDDDECLAVVQESLICVVLLSTTTSLTGRPSL